ncbi:protein FAM177A1-like isoform X2 [Homarus americanus]|uniref:protein FAM177A1-like isoform X2 n=1 Tax=Homarus americanus TaxID=6706 RepID=UPI001C464ABA|nr:protein FAM177A1-like isoform X2 [Homarus americanus]
MSTVDLPLTELCVSYESQGQAVNFTQKDPSQAEEGKCQNSKMPRKILHFSDGVLAEDSTDDENEKDEPSENNALLDPTLNWGPWMYYWMLYTGSSALAACDYLGEGLSNLFGITTPKYWYEIEEYKRCEEEAKAEREEIEQENTGWTTTDATPTADGVQQKVIVSSAIQQPPSPSLSQKEPDNELHITGGSELTEVPCYAPSSSNPPPSSSHPQPTTKVKIWMSKVHMNQVTEMSTWV